jgi:hypothetical protein
MRFALAAALLTLTTACASTQPPEQIVPVRRNAAAGLPPQADRIPLLSAHQVRGCSYDVAGQVVARTPAALRQAAYQKLANAVVDVRRPTEPAPGAAAESSPRAGGFVLVGTAVRFQDAACVPAAETKDAE